MVPIPVISDTFEKPPFANIALDDIFLAERLYGNPLLQWKLRNYVKRTGEQAFRAFKKNLAYARQLRDEEVDPSEITLAGGWAAFKSEHKALFDEHLFGIQAKIYLDLVSAVNQYVTLGEKHHKWMVKYLKSLGLKINRPTKSRSLTSSRLPQPLEVDDDLVLAAYTIDYGQIARECEDDAVRWMLDGKFSAMLTTALGNLHANNVFIERTIAGVSDASEGLVFGWKKDLETERQEIFSLYKLDGRLSEGSVASINKFFELLTMCSQHQASIDAYHASLREQEALVREQEAKIAEEQKRIAYRDDARLRWRVREEAHLVPTFNQLQWRQVEEKHKQVGEGFIYVLSMLTGPRFFKVGFTAGDPLDRLKAANQKFRQKYELVRAWPTKRPFFVEQRIHMELDLYSQGVEHFEVPIEKIIEIVEQELESD